MSKIDICNMALAHLGQAPINSTTDQNERARRCEMFYSVALAKLLKCHPWRFADTTATLAQVADNRLPPPYNYAYARPADALQINAVFSDVQHHTKFWEASDSTGRMLVTYEPAKYVNYTRSVTDTNLFDAAFTLALSWELAAQLAPALTKSNDDMSRAQQQALITLDAARYQNRAEGDNNINIQSTYLNGL